MTSLTPRQHDALTYLTAHPRASLREIGAAIGVTGMRGLLRLLDRLEERGRIHRTRNRSRSIKVLKPAHGSPSDGMAFARQWRETQPYRELLDSLYGRA